MKIGIIQGGQLTELAIVGETGGGGGGAANQITVTTPVDLSYRNDEVINHKLIATASKPDKTVFFGSSNLPTGLSLSPTGLLTGTVEATGTHNIEVIVSSPEAVSKAIAVNLVIKGYFLATPAGMTSNENNDWIVSTDSIHQTNDAWCAFRNSNMPSVYDTPVWHSGTGSMPHWVAWKNKNQKQILNKLILAKRTINDTGAPSAFKVQGSDDGTNWTDIKSFSINSSNYVNTKFTCDLNDNLNAYYYHRLYITSASGSSYTMLAHIVGYRFEDNVLPIEPPVEPELPANSIVVSGTGIAACNGTYLLENQSSTGADRVWRKGERQYINFADSSYPAWNMYTNAPDINGIPYYAFGDATSDITTLTWELGGYGVEPAPTVTHGNTPPVVEEKIYDLVVSGAGYTNANGTYKLIDNTKIGHERQWKNENRDFYIFYKSGEFFNNWYLDSIFDIDSSSYGYRTIDDVDEPYLSTWTRGEAPSPAPTVTEKGA